MILCTKSGHVFIRTRVLRGGINLGSNPLVNPPKNSPVFKFHRVPALQRITRVCANSTGAFAALRIDAVPKPIRLTGPTMAADLEGIQPFRSWAKKSPAGSSAKMVDINGIVEESNPLLIAAGDDDETTDLDVAPDIHAAFELCDFLTHSDPVVNCEDSQHFMSISAHHGADILFKTGDSLIPAHKALLIARVPVMRRILSGQPLNCTTGQHKAKLSMVVDHSSSGHPTIDVTGCSPMTILILCYYLYTDRVVTIWDRRVSLAISDKYSSLNIDVPAIKAQLRVLASQSCLQLHSLEATLNFVGKAPSNPTLNRDLDIFGGTRIAHDVIVHLADKEVKAHSFVLRSRSLYFSTFFDEECWTRNRFQLGNGTIEIDLKEFKFVPMSYLFRYLYQDKTQELFHDLGEYQSRLRVVTEGMSVESIQTSERFIEFMFEVIACSVCHS
jgi:inhibitor of Bruton tyrosine kinase